MNIVLRMTKRMVTMVANKRTHLESARLVILMSKLRMVACIFLCVRRLSKFNSTVITHSLFTYSLILVRSNYGVRLRSNVMLLDRLTCVIYTAFSSELLGVVVKFISLVSISLSDSSC
jgi:hypothetical protein